jgi:hypothetical protein
VRRWRERDGGKEMTGKRWRERDGGKEMACGGCITYAVWHIEQPYWLQIIQRPQRGLLQNYNRAEQKRQQGNAVNKFTNKRPASNTLQLARVAPKQKAATRRETAA